MIAEQRDAGLLAKGARMGGRTSAGPVVTHRDNAVTLDQAGIDKNLADRARKTAAADRHPERRHRHQVEANMMHGGDRRSDQAAKLPLEKVSQAEAAKMVGVSERLVRDAVKVKNAAPDSTGTPPGHRRRTPPGRR